MNDKKISTSGGLKEDEQRDIGEDLVNLEEFQNVVAEVLGTLTYREKDVLILRFGLRGGRKRTLKDVGNKYGVTGGRISQIQANALKKLRYPSRSRKLKQFIGMHIDYNSQLFLCAIFGIKHDDWFLYKNTSSISLQVPEKTKGNMPDEYDWENSTQKKPISKLNLSVRSYTCLKRSGCDIVHDLSVRSAEEMKQVRNLGQKRFEEVYDKMYELNVHFRPKEKDPFLYGYPPYIKTIAAEERSCWEYYLYIEVMIINYKWLSEFRKEEIILAKEDNNPTIYNFDMLSKYLHDKTAQMESFGEKMSEAINIKAAESFGPPGEKGDKEKIVSAALDFMKVYRDLINWKLSISKITVINRYRKVIEELYSLANQVLSCFDKFYSKLIVARTTIENFYMGRIEEKDINIDLSVSLDVDFDRYMTELRMTALMDKYQ